MELQANFNVVMKAVDGKHLYYVEGEDRVYNSVTWFLNVINKGFALDNWKRDQILGKVEASLSKHLGQQLTAPDAADILHDAKYEPEKALETAGDWGTMAHGFFDDIISGRRLRNVPPEMRDSISAFRDYWAQSGLTMVLPDTKVVSKIHNYGGAFDALCVDGGGDYVVIDWKTNKSRVYPEAGFQVAAYGQAVAEVYGVIPKRGLVVRFAKADPADWEVREVEDMRRALDIFLHAKCLREGLSKSPFIRKARKKKVNA